MLDFYFYNLLDFYNLARMVDKCSDRFCSSDITSSIFLLLLLGVVAGLDLLKLLLRVIRDLLLILLLLVLAALESEHLEAVDLGHVDVVSGLGQQLGIDLN